MEKLNDVQNKAALKADAVEEDPDEVLSSYEVKSAFKKVASRSSEEEIQSEAVLENLYSSENSDKIKLTPSDHVLASGKDPPAVASGLTASAVQLETVDEDPELPREAWYLVLGYRFLKL